MERPSTERSFWHTLPGMMTAVAGIITAVASLILALNQAGILRPDGPPEPPVPVVRPAPQPVEPDPSPPLRPEPQPAPASAEPEVSVWATADGTVFRMRQQGNQFAFDAENRFNGLRAWGSGTFHGLEFKSTFQTNIPSTGHGSGRLTPDGRQSIGRYFDSALGWYDQTPYRN